MKQFPNNIIFDKSHKKKSYRGIKAQGLSIYTTGLRIKQHTYLSYTHFETMRRTMVRCLRPKGVKNTKNQLLIRSRMQNVPRRRVFRRKRRRAKKKTLKRFSKRKKISFILRHHFYSPITKKPLQVRMGKGKGSPYSWVYPISAYKYVLELSRKTLNLRKIRRYSKKASLALPRSVKLIYSRKYLRREHNFKIKNCNRNIKI